MQTNNLSPYSPGEEWKVGSRVRFVNAPPSSAAISLSCSGWVKLKNLAVPLKGDVIQQEGERTRHAIKSLPCSLSTQNPLSPGSSEILSASRKVGS